MPKRLWIVLSAILMIVSMGGPVLARDVKDEKVIFSEKMSFREMAETNGISVDALLKKLGLNNSDSGLMAEEVNRIGLTNSEQIKDEIRKMVIETQMEKSKNWKLIFTKFVLWVLSVVTISSILQSKKGIRFPKVWLAAAIIVFGVILGSDPNPLGVVKDGLLLYAQQGVLFKPRFVALAFLLVLTILFSRIFCGWACQIGTVQELLYRVPIKKIRLSFRVTNSIRGLVFFAMILSAFVFGADILGPIDPFKIYSFSSLTKGVIAFFIVLVITSTFIYRPWCTAICPFGLLAWAVNKVSLLKLRFNKVSCRGCDNCVAVCPTGAARSLRDMSFQSECFMCNRCREACPTGSIFFGSKTSKKAPGNTLDLF